MTSNDHRSGGAESGDHIVGAPLSTDAIGLSLRGAFVVRSLPADFGELVSALDRVTHH